MSIPCTLESFNLPDLITLAMISARNSGCPNIRQVACPADTFLTDLSPWIPDFIDALTRPLTAEEAADGTYAPPVPPRIAMTGTYDEMMAYFEGDLVAQYSGGPYAWMTDGGPVVPPTEERVARMLTGTSHSPDEVIEFSKGKYTATIERIAVNAVMAGCKPEYMPVVLSIAETGACVGYGGDMAKGHMYVVSGPIGKEIGMNQGFALLTSGNPANVSLKRVCSLMGINLGKCEFGINMLERTGPHSWGTIFAENPNTPWDTLNVNFGYDADESVLVYWSSDVLLVPFKNIYISESMRTLEDVQCSSPEALVETLKLTSQGAIALFCPDTAFHWASKYDCAKTMQTLKDYLWDNVTQRADDWYSSYLMVTHPEFMRKYEAKERGTRQLNPDHLNLPDDAQVPKLDSPDSIVIVVAGGTGDCQTWGATFGPPKTYSIDKWR